MEGMNNSKDMCEVYIHRFHWRHKTTVHVDGGWPDDVGIASNAVTACEC